MGEAENNCYISVSIIGPKFLCYLFR